MEIYENSQILFCILSRFFFILCLQFAAGILEKPHVVSSLRHASYFGSSPFFTMFFVFVATAKLRLQIFQFFFTRFLFIHRLPITLNLKILVLQPFCGTFMIHDSANFMRMNIFPSDFNFFRFFVQF